VWYELANVEIALLGNHVSEQGIGGDVKGYAQKQIGAALVELAGEFAVVDVELKQAMTWGQCHTAWRTLSCGPMDSSGSSAGFQAGNNQTAGIGFLANLIDQVADLVNHSGRLDTCQLPPLFAVYGAPNHVIQSPFIPDVDLAFGQPVVVSGALQEPQQLLDDAAQVNLFCGDQGKPCCD